MRPTLIGLAVAGTMGAVAPAWAFAPSGERPWAETPERFVRTLPDHPAPKVIHGLVAEGLRPWSYRPDGTVAYAYRSAGAEAQANLSPEEAGEVAESLARRLAPELGLEPADLRLASVHPLDGFTTVFVAQHHRGLEVPRGFLVFGFQGAALTSLRNELLLTLAVASSPSLTAEKATGIALRAARGWAPGATKVGLPSLVVWSGADDGAEARLAHAVRVRSEAPRAELTFYVDAVDGRVLAADDEVRWADGEGRIRMVVDTVNPDSGTAAFTVPGVYVGGQPTDSDGELQGQGGGNVTYEGPRARVRDVSGQGIEDMTVTMSGPYRTYDIEPSRLSQADPFVHINLVKAWAERITPTVGWIDERLTVNVNLNDTCNAYWDGQTVNFYRSGGGCNNTGRVTSIVYHEFGHGYHQNLTRNVVGSIGEGTGDFLAATILDDAVVGRGFSTNGSGIRRIDRNNSFPDDYTGEVHEDGLIWASALWELRGVLMAKHGDWAGRLIVDRAFVRAVSRGPGLSSAYPSFLEGDDDDGDIDNGTPNSCEITAVFDAHGLVDGGQINHNPVPGLASARILHDEPGRILADADGNLTFTASVENRSACGQVAIEDLQMFVARDSAGGTWQSVPLTVIGQQAQATLTDAIEGEILRYRFEIQVDGRTSRVGTEEIPLVALVDPGLEDLHVEGFEADFGAWTHGTVGSDLHDDWEIAEPLGQAFDPYQAREGRFVVGTDLGNGGAPGGTDGAAKPGRSTFLESPPLTTADMENVHLELWQHFAAAGTLKVLVDGVEVYRYTGTGDAWSGGWRYLPIPLGETARDRKDGLVIRFEVETAAGNVLGGWSLDDLRISGVAIPPPPPPPPPPPEEPPPEEPPPQQPTDPLPETPETPADEPIDGFTRHSIGGGCTCLGAGGLAGSSTLWLLAGLIVVGRRRKSLTRE